MQNKQESLNAILAVPERERRKLMLEYAFNLIRRDLSHIANQANMRQANSKELDDFIRDLAITLNYYNN